MINILSLKDIFDLVITKDEDSLLYSKNDLNKVRIEDGKKDKLSDIK